MVKVHEKFSKEIIFATVVGFLGIIVAILIHFTCDGDIGLTIAYTITYEVSILSGTAIYAFVKYIKNEKKTVNPFQEHLNLLNTINSINNENIKNYILKELIISEILKYQKFVSGSEIICPYSIQIQLADGISMEAKNYFWATSLDSPTVLFRQGIHYFSSLQKLNIPNKEDNIIPSKSRIVMRNFDDLYSDFEKDRNSFQSFIDWHTKNNWGLKFYIRQINEIESDFKKFINESLPIQDFLIKDGECVYGRVEQVDTNNVKIKLILNEYPKITEYSNFFETLWANSLSSQSVVQKISKKMGEKYLRDALIKDYRDFVGKENGQDFFLKVCDNIEKSNSEVFAIDVADLKETVIAWKTNIAYQGFLTACKNAAMTNEVSRIFVLTNFDSILLKDSIEIIVEQLSSNLNIGLIEKTECESSGMFVQDFIIASNQIGFKLDDEQTFNIDSLSLVNNLILKNKFPDYLEHFKKLEKYVADKGQYFKKVSAIDDFKKFIENLKTTNKS